MVCGMFLYAYVLKAHSRNWDLKVSHILCLFAFQLRFKNTLTDHRVAPTFWIDQKCGLQYLNRSIRAKVKTGLPQPFSIKSIFKTISFKIDICAHVLVHCRRLGIV